MKRFILAAAMALMLGSQADAQVVISTGGWGQPAGIYTPFGSIGNTSGYYTSGYYSPYTTSYYTPYSTYGTYYTPTVSSGYYYPSSYNTGYYNTYRPSNGNGMYRGRGWRW